jgi:FkbM family methyltransferase
MKFSERIKKRIELETRFDQSEFNNLLSVETKFIIGRNNEALNILNNNQITGIIDDYFEESTWHSYPIYKLENIQKSSLIINCSTSISPNSVLNKLNNNGFLNILNYSDFINSNPLIYLPTFSREMISLLEEKRNDFDFIFEKFSDDFSRNIFEDLILFRITCNPFFTKNYKLNIENQYLEDFMNFNNEVFVDAGGFDGDTSELFLEENQYIKKIYFVEPSKYNLKNAQKRLKNYTNIEYLNFGLSDKNETLSFNECNNTASYFSEEGEMKINVKRLDDLISEEVTLIKMDIEGFEMKALAGSERIIREFKPKLAIAVYHKSYDFFEIPKYILKINPDYKLYLRHYTQGWSETVMYFNN